MEAKKGEIKRARNDLPCTGIDDLLPSYDLSTITKQVTTYDDGSFDRTGYLISLHATSRLHKTERTQKQNIRHPVRSSLDPIR